MSDESQKGSGEAGEIAVAEPEVEQAPPLPPTPGGASTSSVPPRPSEGSAPKEPPRPTVSRSQPPPGKISSLPPSDPARPVSMRTPLPPRDESGKVPSNLPPAAPPLVPDDLPFARPPAPPRVPAALGTPAPLASPAPVYDASLPPLGSPLPPAPQRAPEILGSPVPPPPPVRVREEGVPNASIAAHSAPEISEAIAPGYYDDALEAPAPPTPRREIEPAPVSQVPLVRAPSLPPSQSDELDDIPVSSQLASNPPPAPRRAEEDSVKPFQEQEPPSFPTDDNVAEPIRAMRVIKLTEHTSKRDSALPPSASPSVEDAVDVVEPVPDSLAEEQIEEVASAAPAADEVPVEFSDEEDESPPPSVEPIEEVESVENVPPPPVRREEGQAQPVVPPADRRPPPPRRSAKPSLPTVKKVRNKPWWETLFGDDFSHAYRPMNQSQLSREVDFILAELQIPKGAVILDLGCGQGEICVELSRRGYSVVGYDLSVFQLAMAGDNAQQAKQKINFLQGDMREMAFDQMFDAVICWDTTFGYFEDEKNIDVLRRIKNALKPSGRFLLDVMNRDFAAREAPMNHWFEGDGCVCMDDMGLDWITNELKVKRSIILDDGRSKELQYSTRLYTLSEVGRMLHDVGFRVAKVSGDVATQGAFFGPHSRRIIIQAGKP